MKHIEPYIKLNAPICIVYLSTSLYRLFKAPKHFSAYNMLNALKPHGAYIVVNTPKCVLY